MENVMMYMYGAGSTKYERDKKQKNKPDIMVVSEDGKTSYQLHSLIAQYPNSLKNSIVQQPNSPIDQQANSLVREPFPETL